MEHFRKYSPSRSLLRRSARKSSNFVPVKTVMWVVALSALLAALLCGPPAYAAQGQGEKEKVQVGEVVVTATRLETPVREVASSMTVITGQEIEQEGKTEVLEVLRDEPALDVVRTGGPGGVTSIFIRGADSDQTLVLIDGIEVNDPIFNRAFDFANLAADNIERIEVLRGPQSTIYGSEAMGGVINIITRRGGGKPRLTLSGEAGSFDTYRLASSLSGGYGPLDYSLGASWLDTKGISAASEKDGNKERDGHQNATLSARLGIKPAEALRLDLTARYTDSEKDIDNFGGPGGDDPNHVFETRQLLVRAGAGLTLLEGLWEQQLGLSLTDYDSDERNDPDPDHPGESLRSSFDSTLLKADWQHNLYLHETNTLTLGLEADEERGESSVASQSPFGPYTSEFAEETARTKSAYAEDQIKLWDRLFSTVGVRLDDHDQFGSKVTYRVTAAYIVKETGTKLKATYGTGFKAPTLFQLFDPTNGNPDLAPEASTGFDAGVEQVLWEDRLAFGATYFANDFEDLIEFVLLDPVAFTGTFRNVSKAESRGVEVFASLSPTERLAFRADYTYMDTEDKTTGEQLLRRARNKFKLTANYAFSDRGNLNLGVSYTGQREDLDFSVFPSERVKLKGYTLVDLAASYGITKNLEVFGRVENLLDQDYEEVKGYGTPGISAYAGLKATL
jgi:vitamin B12 transporter